MGMQLKATPPRVKPIRYVGVFVVLAVITAIEFFISGQVTPETRTLIIITLVTLSLIKASLVMAFFMHLKYDARAYSLLLIFPLFMAVLLAVVVIIASQPI
jgi:cytochrome c oxidase subunit 4